jgi:NAD(P)H-flavin reductase
VGVVTELINPQQFDPGNAVAYLCGPEVMMRFSAACLMDAGLAAESIYVSMERNMKCAIGHCGHCQFGPHFICKDGAVFRYDRVQAMLALREI